MAWPTKGESTRKGEDPALKSALATIREHVSSAKGRAALSVLEAECSGKKQEKTFGGKPPKSAKGNAHSSSPFAKRMAKGQGAATAQESK